MHTTQTAAIDTEKTYQINNGKDRLVVCCKDDYSQT